MTQRVVLPAELTFPARFAGPPGSANGGYVAGRLAACLPDSPTVVVTLRRPPPLDVALTVERESASGPETGIRLMRSGVLVAEAAPGRLADPPPAAVDLPTAERAGRHFAGLHSHPFPGCFVCGVDPGPDEALCLTPGRLPDRPDAVATAWVPAPWTADGDGVVRPELAWAALDCPGGWAVDLPGRPMVLGRVTGRVDALPRAGRGYVVVGEVRGRAGRKAATASALYAADGALLAETTATWIAVDPASLARPPG